MDVLLRSIAILIEGLVLAAITYHMLNGVRLMLFDLGVKPAYAKIVTLAFVTVGCLLFVFFAAHLITFYPTI